MRQRDMVVDDAGNERQAKTNGEEIFQRELKSE